MVDEGRRARQRIAKRAAIRSAAVRLALDRGLEAATVEAISQAADIAPRTFFNYFATKNEVFSIEPHQWTAEEITAELHARPENEPPVESMRAVIKVMAAAVDFEHFEQEWELLRQLYERYPPLFSTVNLDEVDRSIALLSDEIVRRRPATDADSLFAPLLVGASFAALQTAENRSRLDTRPLTELIDEAFDQLGRGFTA
jgi:AcrR family transcriptional regulator